MLFTFLNCILHRESRYILLLTENYGALNLLHQLMGNEENTHVIFGSSFPKDQEYIEVYNLIFFVFSCCLKIYPLTLKKHFNESFRTLTALYKTKIRLALKFYNVLSFLLNYSFTKVC